MTYSQFETSQQQSQPIELYEFSLGLSTYRFTSSEDELTVAGQVYEPAAIRRTAITISSENRQEIVTITLPATNQFAMLFIDIVPGQTSTMTIKRLQRLDIGVGDEVITIFKGIVKSVGFSRDSSTASISVAPLNQGLSREIPRFTYQGLCNHVLYDSGCKVLQNDFRFQGEVTVVSGSTLTVPGLNAESDGFYTGGFVQLASNDFRLVTSHAGNVVTLLLPFRVNVTGSLVDVFAGCDHSLATCKAKFDNVANYGGFAFVPLKDIFRNGLD